MANQVALILALTVVLAQTGWLLGKAVIPEEPVCTSRYGFESSLLKDMIQLNFDMTVLKQRYSDDIDSLRTQTDIALGKLDTKTKDLEQAQNDKLDELTSLENNLKAKTETMKKELDDAKETLEDKFTAYQQSVEKKIEDITAAAFKRPVAFLVNTVSDTTATSGMTKVLKFTKSVWNTNGDYDTTSGYFTAPYNGTYTFHIQLCLGYNKYVHVQMVADDTVFNKAVLYDGTGGNPCRTVSGVAVLARGNRVCARLGSGSSSGTILYQSSARWAAFMGALVH